jgi:3-hydroxyacyl-CoA dehydrogenase
MPISIDRRDGIMVIRVDNPPVNALGADVRRGLEAAVHEAELDPAIAALVIVCSGRSFFSGADIGEFGKPIAAPKLPDLCRRIEAAAKPIVAAMHGAALGGGLEVALACHYRVALETASFAMPEVKLGLLPGAGGTQRLPRLVGVAKSLDMIALGQSVGAIEAHEIGLIDRIFISGSLLENSVAFARTIARIRPLPRARERSVMADDASFHRFEQRHGRKLAGQAAPAACLEAIHAATSTLMEEGERRERALFGTLMNGPQSKALRHLFFAERKAAKFEGLNAGARSIEAVGVIGAGTMGAGIALACLSAGLFVTLLDADEESLNRGLTSITKAIASAVAKGRLEQFEADGQISRLTIALDYQALACADLVIEAAFELLEVKREIFGRLDAVLKPGAILATNTSYLDLDLIAACSGRPDAVVGLHFFSPANIMRLLEVVRGRQTAPEVLASALAFARRLGKAPVVSGVCTGFIGNRMLSQRRAQAFALLLEGATPQQIDEAHVAFGLPMGPFQMSDLAGVDIGWHRDPSRIESIRDALCANGRVGQKVGKGYYDYGPERRADPSDEVQAIIDGFARTANVSRRTFTSADILERCLYPMISEGAQILSEGIARRASDIDVVWANGYGWPRTNGGPMYWADQLGAVHVVARLEAHGLPVARFLSELAVTGARFTS